MLSGMSAEDAEAPEAIRGHIREVGYYRVSHGLFVLSRESVEPEEEFRRQLRAWLLVLPKDAAFTSLTAARIRGWQLPKLPEQTPVFASVQGKRRPRRPGLICSRIKRMRQPRKVNGLPVEPAEETLLRAARDLGLVDLLILVDSARRLKHVYPKAMAALLETTRPGVRHLRAAWELSTSKAQSAGETLLRLFDESMDVPVLVQAKLYDEAGNLVGIADLLVVGTRFLHEYDGGHHRSGEQQRVDLRRERELSRAAYDRRGVTLDDLLNHAAVLMHEVDRDLERPHVPARLTRWKTLVANSLYSEAGRRRVMNRWQRQMGVTVWQRTA